MSLNNNQVACRVGCAGWTVPKHIHSESQLSHLEQYAHILNCVEINSSFYRNHQQKTYIRWSESVPDSFRFSVKVPKLLTHTSNPFEDTLSRFFDEVVGLGEKLEVLLLQFPPKKEFDRKTLTNLLIALRKDFKRRIVCEARHATWFNKEVNNFYKDFSVTPVIADPQAVPEASDISSAQAGAYFRLHGTPRVYYSDYSDEFLKQIKGMKALQSPDTWVIFDNTAAGYGFGNARALLKL